MDFIRKLKRKNRLNNLMRLDRDIFLLNLDKLVWFRHFSTHDKREDVISLLKHTKSGIDYFEKQFNWIKDYYKIQDDEISE